MNILVETSARHVHVTEADLETLFGAGYRLNRTKDLSQPGQFACAERVTLEGPRGSLKNVVILGPERPESQVEISLTDAVALGLTPPVRLSGDTEGTPGLTLRHGDRVLRLSRGLIVAKRHIHMTPEDAARFGVADRQRVRLQCFTSRPLVFQDVEGLKSVGLTVPDTTELLWELRREGLDVPLDALSDDECAQALKELLAQRRN